MIYNIRHITSYRYQTPVGFSRCTLRQSPRSCSGQVVHSHRCVVTPAPAVQTTRVDYFGNQVTSIIVDTAHKDLQIVMSTSVDVDRASPPHAALTPTWRQIKRAIVRTKSLTPNSPAHFVYPSPMIPIVSAITSYGLESFAADRPILESAIELMNRIRADFLYDPEATDISTPLHESFEGRAGVCQDFAHIMIAALRGLGIPSAYVSGYIRTIPPPGKPRLEGADASHAWVSVWCGDEFGWLDLDPTNALQIGNDHIVLAVGRDYGDVSPLDGVIVGSGVQELSVSVDVAPQIAQEARSRRA